MPRQASEMVKEFHTIFNHPIHRDGPASANEDVISRDRLQTRVKFIAEELVELLAELREDDGDSIEDVVTSVLNEEPVVDRRRQIDTVALVDALGDMLYFIHGLALEIGADLDRVVETIHESNMSKLGEDNKPIYREDNKVLKGPNFFKPEPKIAEILKDGLR